MWHNVVLDVFSRCEGYLGMLRGKTEGMMLEFQKAGKKGIEPSFLTFFTFRESEEEIFEMERTIIEIDVVKTINVGDLSK